MSIGKEISTKVVRISPSVKKRLEIFQGGDTPNVVIDRMLTFFEVTGYNPRYASRIRRLWWKRELRILSE